MNFKRVGIIGLGLIGGSIAKTLKAQDPTVKIRAKDERVDVLKSALAQKVIDQTCTSIEELSLWAEVIIVATPLSELISIGKQIAAVKRKEPLIVLDVSSVKAAVVPVLEELTTGSVEFVSTHPMAGKEVLGFGSSFSSLFQDATWIITPHCNNKEQTLLKIKDWLAAMGARPVSLSVEKHDMQVALISHLPFLISQALLDFVNKEDFGAIALAGPGFHSMTRLAKTPPQLAAELTTHNRQILGKYWKRWIAFLEEDPYGTT